MSHSAAQLDEAPAVHSVLEGVTPDDLQDFGFPVLIRANALPEDYFLALAESYPDYGSLPGSEGRKKNTRYRWEAERCLAYPAMPEIWRRFIAYHSSHAFFDEVRRIFGAALLRQHPGLQRNFGKALEDFSVGLRRQDKRGDPRNLEDDIVLDVQLSWNPPVAKPAAPRGPHLDNPNKMYNSLLYFRDPEDSSNGGDLTFHRLKQPGYPRPKASRIDASTVTEIATVPYAANTLVLFVNAPQAIHSVSPRSVSPATRRFVAIMGDCYGGRVPDFFTAPETRSPYWWRQALRAWHRYI